MRRDGALDLRAGDPEALHDDRRGHAFALALGGQKEDRELRHQVGEVGRGETTQRIESGRELFLPFDARDSADRVLNGGARREVHSGRADGVLVIVFNDETRMAVVRSLDGGATLTATTPIAPITYDFDARLRDPPLPSAEIAGDGTIYTVWPNCAADVGCSRIDLVISSSADGVTWSAPARVPTPI